MYKKEGHEQFQALQAKIEHDIVHTLFNARPSVSSSNNGGQQTNGKGAQRGRQAPPKKETVMAKVMNNRTREAVPAGQKIGRNQQCPCGSGKKYKRCHGA
ncbi:MAG: SEC-C domain-containing protein [Chloroflexi bacterium]|nr:SEC-C domain-containing protein [Chloroflexota bacterium]